MLVAGGEGVDPELRAETDTGRAEPLAEDLGAGPLLVHAVPDDHEVARGVGGDRRLVLGAGREGVDLELRLPTGAPELAKRCAKTPSPEPSCGLVHTTTNAPVPLDATSGSC